MKRFNTIFFICFGIATATAQFLDKKEDLTNFNGFFDFHYSEKEGEIYLEVPSDKIEKEFLYVHSLRTGLGSNDIGLDRGQLGGQKVVKFIKSGNKLLLLEPNLRYRATTDNQLEKKSIEEAFAKSVLFGFDIKETKDNTYIIDITSFLMQDRHGVAQRLKSNKQGTYKLDKTRNSLWMERTKAFPKNVEFEALLTFVGEAKGGNIRSVAPDASSVSVVQHHSFVALPDDNYTPRIFDPRSGSFSISYQDYSSPIWEPLTKRFITRHRLEKINPSALKSEAKEPIVYYLDPGTPEPVRSALLEGARWWNQAFEAIGYTNAFQVKMLPNDADPMDVRYNVIQWVHRSTRGWSYGGSVIDPRTGEILKGHVSLGSLRIRQDFMIAQALSNKPFAQRDDNHSQLLEMALARIRQLSAHEVGHTLGFAHNFAASTNNRASVMDYPHPSLRIKNGQIDFTDAYATGIGNWDKVTVAYSYSNPKNDVPLETHLNSILEGAYANGLRYITDSDARAKSGAHAKAHLWDNGKSATEELKDILKLREIAITNFSEDNIRTGEPYTVLEDVFVPLYFYHRYQTEAAVKLIGGLDYNYAVKGYSGDIVSTLPKRQQKEALNAVLQTLQVETLIIPEDKLKLFPPRAYGYWKNRESFKSNVGVAFDAMGASATAADMTLKLLLHPERANRLVQQKALNPNNIGLEDVLQSLIETTFNTKANSTYKTEVKKTIQYVVFQHLLNLYYSKSTVPQARVAVLETLQNIFSNNKDDDLISLMAIEFKKYEAHPDTFKYIKYLKIPDGSPIGSFQCTFNH
ncbi:zinc-dependent metalloprotease [Patiriisocius hiemis]|uniref:Zinc-dependent metalloprotease n=1 Tax=Patiriisocius hiemis TaxID=3075604 RepID=A0ABU2YBB8_9FLAO|nr:zinc-dependent metalloprotease [Constantimarinum sp. W242]MDT0555090.1 zinc-dependent metalloprotease [Constantimarinum sp. W242]